MPTWDTVNQTLAFGPWSVGIVQDQASNGRPELRIWLTGDPNYIVGGSPFAGGAGTLGAPTLGFPTPLTSTPISMSVTIPADSQPNDVFKIAMSASPNMTSYSVLTHSISSAEAAASAFTIGIAIPPFSITYFQALMQHAGVDSQFLSNKVAWGSNVAPVITTGAATNNTETIPLAITLTATTSVGVLAWMLTGGPDILTEEISGNTLRWASNGSQQYLSPIDSDFNNTYITTLVAQDYCGNISSTFTETVTVQQADTTPDAFSYTNQTGVPISTMEFSGAASPATVSGLGIGINAPGSITVADYSLDGGTNWFTAGTSFTRQNGDAYPLLRMTSASTGGTVSSANITIGTATVAWQLTTAGSSAAFNTTVVGNQFNFTNSNKTAILPLSSGDTRAFSVAGKTTGKWYWEATPDASNGNTSAGIGGVGDPVSGWSGVLDALYFLNGGLSGPGSPGGPYGAYSVGGASRPCFTLDLLSSPPRLCVGLVNISTHVITWGNGVPGTSGLDISSLTTPIKAIVHATVINDQWTLRLAAADQVGTPPAGFSSWS